MKHLLTAASIVLGACSTTPEVRDPNAEEQAVIDAIIARGAFEHSAVAEMVTRSDASFFNENGEAADASAVVSSFADMAELVTKFHREGKILVFDPSEETSAEVDGVADEHIEGMSHADDTTQYIALNAQEKDRWSFGTFMHEGAHQLAPEWEHSKEFAELAEGSLDGGVTQTQIAETAFRTHDFPHLAGVEYSRLDSILSDEAGWLSDVAKETQARVESGELSQDAALAEYDERTEYATETVDAFAAEHADIETELFPDFYAVLGNTEDDLNAAFRAEGPYAFVEMQRAQYREGLEKWLTEREEGERRMRRESDEAHRTRRR